jgi:hypothetical protein
MKARSARPSPTLITTEQQAGFLTTGYAVTGAARFLCRQPAIYSGLAPPNNSARNSDNPNCSFATLFEDKTCPNVKCCITKSLDGCYECKDLADCRIGFYDTKEQVAKATALFIQKYGKETYNSSLVKAIQDGVKYPHQFNEMEDIVKMIELLEKYI